MDLHGAPGSRVTTHRLLLIRWRGSLLAYGGNGWLRGCQLVPVSEGPGGAVSVGRVDTSRASSGGALLEFLRPLSWLVSTVPEPT
jgi:hypothetical protein